MELAGRLGTAPALLRRQHAVRVDLRFEPCVERGPRGSRGLPAVIPRGLRQTANAADQGTLRRRALRLSQWGTPSVVITVDMPDRHIVIMPKGD